MEVSPPPGFEKTIFEYPVPFAQTIVSYEKKNENGLDIGAWVGHEATNGAKSAHGGFLMLLGDIATSRLAWSAYAPQQYAIHVNYNMRFFSFARLGAWVEARAKVDKKGGALIFSSCEFYADGKIIGQADSIMKCVNR